MLLFGFEGYETVTRRDFMLAWTPLIALDLSIFVFMAGLLLWYTERTQGSEDKIFNSLASGFFLCYLGLPYVSGLFYLQITAWEKKMVRLDCGRILTEVGRTLLLASNSAITKFWY